MTLPMLNPDSGSVTEDESLATTGNLLANDQDNNGLTLSLVSVDGTAIDGPATIAGTYGTLAVQPNGQYTYTLNDGSPPVRALTNGQTLPETFTYIATDGQTYTQTTTQTVTNLVTQSEAFDSSAWVPYTSGGAAPVVTANTQAGPNGGAGTADQLALSSAGSGLYFQTAAAGTSTFSIWVKLVSGGGNFTLNYYSGSSGAITTQAEVATGTWTRVSLTFTGDANSFSNVSIGEGAGSASSGTFELWGAQVNSGATAQTYVPTTGSAASMTTTATSPAVLSSMLTIGVTGNTPVANPDGGAVTENGTLTATGNLLANDTDGAGKMLTVVSVNGVAVSGSTTIAGVYGTLVAGAGGQYSYTLNNSAANVQALAAGQVVQDPFSYVVSDGQSYLQTSTQTAENLIPRSEAFDDPSWVPYESSGTAPAVSANVGAGPDGGAATADEVTYTNANSGLYFQTPVSGTYTFSVWVRLVSGSGSFAFGYYSGSSNSVSLQPAVATPSWTRVTFTFTGDGNGYSNISLGEGSGQPGTTSLEFWGAQLNPGATAQAYIPTAGSPVVTTTGSTSPATIGSTLSISVTGAATTSPPIVTPDTATVVEDGSAQTAAGNVLSNDTVFGGRTLAVVAVNGIAVDGATAITGSYGTLAIQPDGQYAYTLNDGSAAVRALANGQTVPDVFSYTVTDGQHTTTTVTRLAQNLITQSENFAAPAWTVFTSTGLPFSTITEDAGPGPNGGASTAGLLNLLGPVAGIYYATNVSGQYTFSIWVRVISGDPNFSFNYYDGATGQSVPAAETATGAWQRLSFTFTGGGNAGSNVALMHTALQSGDTVLEIWGAQINAGAMPLDYTPTTGTAVNMTTMGTQAIGTTLTVAVDGVTPVATNDAAAATVGGSTTATGNLLANDTDSNGLALTLASVNGAAINGQTTITGADGMLVVQPNGQYTYTLGTAQPTVQALSAGQTATDAFSYTVSDGTTHTQTGAQVAENLITQSEAFNLAPWTLFSPGALPTLTANVDSGPQGGAATADRIALTAAGAGIAYSTPAPGPYTFSVWVKLVSGSGAFTFNFLDSTAGVNYAQTAIATGSWQRFSFAFAGDGSSNSGFGLELGAGQAGGSFELWGAQLNPGTTADSYVPTTGTASTVVTPVATPAAIGARLDVTVSGSDAGKPGPALDFQGATKGVVADLATGQWSYATTVLPLGDSITYGWSARDAVNQSFTSEGYRGPLWSALLANNDLIDFVGDHSNGGPTFLDPANSGYPGERSDQIAARVPGLLATQHPQDILLLAGINDLKQGFSPASIADNIATVISEAEAADPGIHVYVALILPVASTVASAASIATANSDISAAVQSAAASGANASVVNTSNITSSDILPDGTHPTPAGYALLAQDFDSAILAAQPIVAGTPAGTANAIDPSVASLVGGSGNDLLIGNAGPNFITAGTGNDILEGGGGNDTLVGGTGADEFVFTAVAGQVAVDHFNPAKGDYLDWNIPGLTSVGAVAGLATQTGGSTVINLNSFVPGATVTLAGYTGSLNNSLFGPPAG